MSYHIQDRPVLPHRGQEGIQNVIRHTGQEGIQPVIPHTGQEEIHPVIPNTGQENKKDLNEKYCKGVRMYTRYIHDNCGL